MITFSSSTPKTNGCLVGLPVDPDTLPCVPFNDVDFCITRGDASDPKGYDSQVIRPRSDIYARREWTHSYSDRGPFGERWYSRYDPTTGKASSGAPFDIIGTFSVEEYYEFVRQKVLERYSGVLK